MWNRLAFRTPEPQSCHGTESAPKTPQHTTYWAAPACQKAKFSKIPNQQAPPPSTPLYSCGNQDTKRPSSKGTQLVSGRVRTGAPYLGDLTVTTAQCLILTSCCSQTSRVISHLPSLCLHLCRCLLFLECRLFSFPFPHPPDKRMFLRPTLNITSFVKHPAFWD